MSTPPPGPGERTAAAQAFTSASPGEHVIGWKVDEDQRAELLARIPPRYGHAVADHVTLRSGVHEHSELPGEAAAAVVGRSDDGKGVEALVVQIDGSTRRPDGGTYHITWSLAPGRKARESNDVIASLGWTPLALPIGLALRPARLK